jgi:3-isopropylmalate/(R)-2-methylmalate dehydratase small subunit
MPLPRANVDTDQIVPARFLKKPRSENFGAYLFHDLRADPAFVLNLPAYKEARIVVAGRNFACGSSREHAVWALADGGFRAAIAPSFSDIFSSNALKNGFLPVVLPEETVAAILAALAQAPGTRLTVDLEAQNVIAPGGTHRFEIAPFPKKCLIEGLDEIGYTLGQIDQVAAFERRYEP